MRCRAIDRHEREPHAVERRADHEIHIIDDQRSVHGDDKGLIALDGEEIFFSHVRLHGGPAPVRRFLPELIDRVLSGSINPGKVFDLTLPLDQVAEGYRAMDERRAIKALLRP